MTTIKATVLVAIVGLLVIFALDPLDAVSVDSSLYRICEIAADSSYRRTGDSKTYLADIAICERKY